MAKFNDGAIVRLNSGGPNMTVDWSQHEGEREEACCSWFDKNQARQQQVFKVAMLKAHSPAPPEPPPTPPASAYS